MMKNVNAFPFEIIKAIIRKVPPLTKLFRSVDNRLYQRYLPVYQSMFPSGIQQVEMAIQEGETGSSISEASLEVQRSVIEKTLVNNLYLKFAPPGHYYSTIPSLEELQAEQDHIFSTEYRPIPGVQIPEKRMLDYLDLFSSSYADFPFTDQKTNGLRFYMENGVYAWGEAVILYSLMRHLKPRRIIEVGSGFSSALILDVNERFLNSSVQCTFIDPYPDRLMKLLLLGDAERVTIIPKRLQDVDIDIFQSLEANDIVFFDSTHISKCDSDVNHIIFDVLPRLNSGVFIHFHDVFYPFEYPKRWLIEVGAAWNENYLLRAFLQYNNAFEIEFFNDYVNRFCNSSVHQAFDDTRWLGSSLWIRKK